MSESKERRHNSMFHTVVWPCHFGFTCWWAVTGFHHFSLIQWMFCIQIVRFYWSNCNVGFRDRLLFHSVSIIGNGLFTRLRIMLLFMSRETNCFHLFQPRVHFFVLLYIMIPVNVICVLLWHYLWMWRLYRKGLWCVTSVLLCQSRFVWRGHLIRGMSA